MFAPPKNIAPPATCNRPPAGLIRPLPSEGIDIATIGTRAGQGFRVDQPALTAATTVLEGKYAFSRLREGFTLQCGNVVHLHDMTTRMPMIEAGIKVVLKLEGNAEVSFGGLPLLCASMPVRAGMPCRVAPSSR